MFYPNEQNRGRLSLRIFDTDIDIGKKHLHFLLKKIKFLEFSQNEFEHIVSDNSLKLDWN